MIGQAVETDTAQPITVGGGALVVAVDQASETDASLPADTRKIRVLGQPSETDTAQALTRKKTVTVGQASHTNVAQTITPLAVVYSFVGGVFLYTAANWAGVAFTFEAFMRIVPGGNKAKARVYDLTAGAPVANSDVDVDVEDFTRVRSGPVDLSLIDGHEYRVQIAALP